MTRTGTRDWRDVIAAAPAVELPELLVMLGCQADRPRLVVVAAHPNDETIGAGRLVAAWSRSLGPVTAVLATAGERCVDQVAPDRPAWPSARWLSGLRRRRSSASGIASA